MFQIKQIDLIKKEAFSAHTQIFLVGTDTFALRPKEVDAQQQNEMTDPNFIAQQMDQARKEIDRLISFHQQINKKLSSEKFIQHAKPEVIEKEQKKSTDTLKKIHLQLSKLKHSMKSAPKGAPLHAEVTPKDLNASIEQAETYINNL